MTVHQEINAHLSAAERNPLKRAQHLIAATQHATANGIPHFGRWSESSIHAREAVREQREEERRLKNGGRKIPKEGAEQRSKTAGASPATQPATAGETIFKRVL